MKIDYAEDMSRWEKWQRSYRFGVLTLPMMRLITESNYHEIQSILSRIPSFAAIQACIKKG